MENNKENKKIEELTDEQLEKIAAGSGIPSACFLQCRIAIMGVVVTADGTVLTNQANQECLENCRKGN